MRFSPSCMGAGRARNLGLDRLWSAGTYRPGMLRAISVFSVLLVTSAVLVAVDHTPTDAAVACVSASSDPDGDGWGWENGETCQVGDASDQVSNEVVADPAIESTTDSSNVGENNSGEAPGQERPSSAGTPDCQDAGSDPDGDGFGWENGASCRVTAPTSGASDDQVEQADHQVEQPIEAPEPEVVVADVEAEPNVSERERQVAAFEEQVLARLGEARFAIFEPLIDATGLVIEAAVVSDGARDRIDSVMWRVDGQLEPLADCGEQLGAVSGQLAQNIHLGFSSNQGSIGFNVAQLLSDLITSLNGGFLVSDLDLCQDDSLVSAVEQECQIAGSDPDGDGFGWENGESCRVVEREIPAEAPSDNSIEAEQASVDSVDEPVVPVEVIDASVDEPVVPVEAATDLVEVPIEVADTPVEAGTDLVEVPIEVADSPVEPADVAVDPADALVDLVVGNSVEEVAGVDPALATPPTATAEHPICVADVVGAFGWENARSCRAKEAEGISNSGGSDSGGGELIAPIAGPGDHPFCLANDNGGFGWENNMSCKAEPIVEIGGLPACSIESWEKAGFTHGEVGGQMCEVVRGTGDTAVAMTTPVPAAASDVEDPSTEAAVVDGVDSDVVVVQLPANSDLPLCKATLAGGGTVIEGDEQASEHAMACLVLNFSPATDEPCTVAAWVEAGFEQGRQGGRWCNVVRGPPIAEGSASPTGLGIVQNLRVSHSVRQGAGATSVGAGLVEWDAPLYGSPTRYDVLRDDVYLASVSPGAVNTYLDLGFVSGQNHRYTVYAADNSGARPVNGAPVTVGFFFDPAQGHLNSFGSDQEVEIVAAETSNEIYPGGAARPVLNLGVAQTEFRLELVVVWAPANEGPNPSGYRVDRDGVDQGLVPIPFFYDADVEAGKSYTYTITPFFDSADSVSTPRTFGPNLSVQSQPVVPVPTSITADMVTGVSASQVENGGIQLNWNAPPGWEQGYIDGYQIKRNGVFLQGTDGRPMLVEEPTFDVGLTYPGRTFTDTSTRFLQDDVDVAYSVVAITTRDGVQIRGEESPVVLIAPSSLIAVTDQGDGPASADGEVDPADSNLPASSVEIPALYVDALAELLGTTGTDVERLASKLQIVYSLREQETAQLRQVVIDFNNELRALGGTGFGLTDAELAGQTSVLLADTLLSRIATPLRGVNVGVQLPEYGLESPFLNILAFKNSEEVRSEYVVAHAQNLKTLLNRIGDREPGSGETNSLKAYSKHVAKGLIGENNNETIREVYQTITEGYYPIKRVVGFVNDEEGPEYVHTPTPFSELFNSSTEHERARAYGIEPAVWDLARPYLEVFVMASKSIRSRYTGYLRGVLAIAAAALIGASMGAALATPSVASGTAGAAGASSVAAPTLSLGSKVIIGATSSGAATFIATGDVKEALEGALTGGITGGIGHFKSLGTLTTGQRIALSVMESNLFSEGGGTLGERLFANFVGHQLNGLGAKLAALENVSEFVGGLVEEILTAALKNPGKWNVLGDAAEAYALNYIGEDVAGSVNARIGEHLSPQWAEVGKALLVLAGYASGLAGAEASDLQNFFFRNVLPKIEASAGQRFVTAEGGREALFQKVSYEVLKVVQNSKSVENLELELEKYLSRLAGQYSRTQFVSALTADGAAPSAGVTQFGNLLFLYVSNSYDNDRRANVVSNYMATQGLQIVASFLQGCTNSEVTAANTRLARDLSGARNTYDFQSVLQTTVRYYTSNPKAACADQASSN